MKNIILIFVFLAAVIALCNCHAGSVQKIPILDISNAKVNYHKRRLCMFKPGQEKCVRQDKEPGDIKDLQSKISIFQENQTY